MITFGSGPKDVLVVGAHPDDEIMCGGLLARLSEAGSRIHHYYFSDCAISTQARGFPPEQLLNECEKSRDILGVAADCRGGFDISVRQFPAFRQTILDALIRLRKTIAPQLVLTAATDDIHQDHSTLTNEVIRAFKNVSILGYEMPWNQLQAHHDCLIKLDQAHLDRKIAALACYKTQAGSEYASAEFMIALARLRGIQIGVDYAESFQIIRLVA